MDVNVKVGTRMYNAGDTANPCHFGTVTAVRAGEIQITADYPVGAKPYWIPLCMVSPAYEGHHGTRIVTKMAYQAYRQAQLEQMQARLAKREV